MRLRITALILALSGCSVYATEYHVSTAGLDANPGSKSRPFNTISAAAQIAQPGDVVTVHGGVYRERINPPRGGASDDQRIVYQAVPGAEVVIKGSEIIKDWQKVQEGVWKVALPSSFFGDFNPYSDVIGGEWYQTPKDGYDRHTGAVYLNGQWLEEARTLEKVLAPIGDSLLWKAKVNAKNTTLWAQFKDADPNQGRVEINVRQSVFYPDRPGRNYITVRGFTMRHAATPWSGAMSEQVGLIGTHWSKGWVIEDNVISHSMNTGITLGRYDLGPLGIAMPPATAPGYVQSIELALEHGWSKQTIGSHVVRKNRISHCEKNGIHGSLGGIFSTIEGNTLCDIAVQGWIGGPDVAGLKLLGSHDTLIRDNHIYRSRGFGGIWLDWMAQGTRVHGNLLHDNSQDLFMEVNHGPFLVDHNIFLSPGALRDWSQGGAYVHNLFAGRIVHRPELRRETPYHKAHSTEVAGLCNVPGGDDRFYHNIIVGYEGLGPYDQAAHTMQISGNVYLAGAKPSVHDLNAWCASDFDPGVTLQEKPDGWWLELAVDPTWAAARQRTLITTGLLGRAKVPNAPYEQPDGTPYRFDIDYLGKQRRVKNPTPGPFRFPGKERVRLKVWPKSPPEDKDARLVKPTPQQLAWQEAELGVVFHYDLHVFDDNHYNQNHNRRHGAEAANRFNPTRLDTDQWLRVARDMGARFAILTASHETGFRLWQSDANPYCLKATQWGEGKRDIVAEFIASCKKYDIKPGIYLGTRWNAQLGVWDFKVTPGSPTTQEAYNRMIEAEVEEICSRYGPLFELWFDGGAHGPKQGGPDVLGVFEKYQRDCLFYHNLERADARWGGSESGTVPYPCWATFPYPSTGSGETAQTEIRKNGFSLLKHGDPDGPYWMPAMSDAPLRNHEWFWDRGDETKLYPLEALLKMYYQSVGHNSTLIMGLTPDDRGLMPEPDAKRCKEWGDAIRDIFSHCVGQTQGQGERIELAWPQPATFDHIVLQEDIREGERVRAYTVEVRRGNEWTAIASGTCIGHKRIHRLEAPVTASHLRLRIGQALAMPKIRTLAVYNASMGPK